MAEKTELETSLDRMFHGCDLLTKYYYCSFNSFACFYFFVFFLFCFFSCFFFVFFFHFFFLFFFFPFFFFVSFVVVFFFFFFLFLLLLFFSFFFFLFFFFQEKACKVVLKGAMSRHFFCVLIKTLQVPYCLYTLVIYFFEHEMKICDKFSRKDLCKVVFGPKRVRT